jgi:hypothetical protein
VEGRAVSQQAAGFTKWRFVGPSDERGRPDHIAIIGQVFEYGTDQSDLALRLLHEPNCRHRQVAFFDDPELDTPEEDFEEQKRKAGLYWDDEKGKWKFRNKNMVDFGKTPGKEIPYTKREDLTENDKELTKVWQNKSAPINAIPRKIEKTIKEMDDEEIQHFTEVGLALDKLVRRNKLKEDMTLRRGLGEPVISWIKSGKTKIPDEGFSAFSYHDGVPIMYAERVIGDDGLPERHFFELQAKKSMTAYFIGDANGHYDSEVLFPMGTSFYIMESKTFTVSENGKDMRYVYYNVVLGDANG